MTNNGKFHTIVIILHAGLLALIIVSVVILSMAGKFNESIATFLTAVMGVVGTGFVINGRKVPEPPPNGDSQQ